MVTAIQSRQGTGRDIFGRAPSEYKQFSDLVAKGMKPQQIQAILSERAREQMHRPHNFNDLGRFQNAAAADPDWYLNADVSAIGYMTDNLQAIQSMIEEVYYRYFRLMEFIPIQDGIPEGAETYSYRVTDMSGVGQYISSDGSNAPVAGVSQRNVPYTIDQAGIIAEWTRRDVRAAMMGGIPLDSKTVQSATNGAMRHMENVAFSGDEQNGATGLLDKATAADPTATQIALETLSNANRLTASTGDEISNRLNTFVEKLIVDSAEVFGMQIQSDLCFYVPIELESHLTTRRLSDIDMTAWSYFAKNNLWFRRTGRMPMLKGLAECNNAAVNGTDDRMVVAVKDVEVFGMGIPIMPRVTEMVTNGFVYRTPMEYSFSDVVLKRPRGLIYVDNVSSY